MEQPDNLTQAGKEGDLLLGIRKLSYTVSQAAEALSVSESCIRHWGRSFQEFLQGERTRGNYRLFSPQDLKVLKRIRKLYQSGLYTTSGVKAKLSGSEKQIAESESRKEVLDPRIFEAQEKVFSHLNLIFSEFQYLRREIREEMINNLRADMEHLKLLLTPRKRSWWRFWSK